MVYLDHAATSYPKPPAVREAMVRALDEAGNPGRGAYRIARAAKEVVERARRAVARLIGAPDAARVILTPGATYALNLAIQGIARRGHVLYTELEHNSVLRPVQKMRHECGIGAERIPCPGGGPLDLGALKAALRGLEGLARLVCVNHASNVTGVVEPVAEACRIAHEHGALVLLDAAQTAGCIPIDVEALGADLVAIAGHKGPHGPPGTGALWVREGIGDAAHPLPLVTGGTGTHSESMDPPREIPEGIEAGTPNVPGLAGLAAGIEHVLSVGPAEIARRGEALRARMVTGLAAIPGVRVYGPSDGTFVPVVSFSVAGLRPADAAALLDSRYDIAVRAGLHCAPLACEALGATPDGTVRASAGLGTTDEEIDRLVGAVTDLAAAAGRRERP